MNMLFLWKKCFEVSLHPCGRKFIHYGHLRLGKTKCQKSGLIVLLFLAIQLGELHNNMSL